MSDTQVSCTQIPVACEDTKVGILDPTILYQVAFAVLVYSDQSAHPVHGFTIPVMTNVPLNHAGSVPLAVKI